MPLHLLQYSIPYSNLCTMLQLTRLGRLRLLPTPAIWTEGIRSRHYATITPSVPSESGSSLTDVSSRARRLPKKEGTIADVFSFSNEEPPLPPRFADLKKEIFSDAIIHSWKEVVNELVLATEEIATLGGKVCSDCGG